MIAIHPVMGIGEIAEGDALGPLLASYLRPLQPEAGDFLVVTQKIVSKAEGRIVALDSIEPDSEALEIARTIGKDARLVALALRESVNVVRAAPGVLITRHKLGLVMANAGIDASNLGPDGGGKVLLLPEDPDASAARIAADIEDVLGVAIGVIISDSFGRPWRHGVTNVAIGCAGVATLADRRGAKDRDGRTLQVTQIAYGDQIASAAGLAMGEGAEGVPAVLVKGLLLADAPRPARDLIRDTSEDLFQ